MIQFTINREDVINVGSDITVACENNIYLALVAHTDTVSAVF